MHCILLSLLLHGNLDFFMKKRQNEQNTTTTTTLWWSLLADMVGGSPLETFFLFWFTCSLTLSLLIWHSTLALYTLLCYVSINKMYTC
jgi:hypothetical protein